MLHLNLSGSWKSLYNQLFTWFRWRFSDNNEKKDCADEWNVTRDFSNICDVNISRRTCNKIIFSCSEIKNQVYLCSGCELFFYCLLPFCCCSFSVVDVFPCSSLFFIRRVLAQACFLQNVFFPLSLSFNSILLFY